MSTRYNPSIVRDGLAFYLDAANTKSYPGSGTTWTDISGRGNNGTLTNGPTFSSDNLGNIAFDGSNDYVNASAVLSAGQQKYTLSAWWNLTNIGSGSGQSQVVMEQNSSAATTHRRACILLNSQSQKWGFNGQNNDKHSEVPLQIGQWVNGVVTIDTTGGSSGLKLYENGSLYFTGTTDAGISNLNVGTHAFAIGHKVSTGTEHFQGKISCVSVYRRVLTALEVKQNYDALRGRFGI
tara:strand:+ start:3257 stop:3967 length:711 start_codon:yes stop_codon:yes gene_type:complete